MTAPPFSDVREDDIHDFESVYRRYDQHVLRLLIWHAGVDRQTAIDLHQEVFIRVWQKLESFGGRSALTTWIHGVARYVALEHWRKGRALRARRRPPPNAFEQSASQRPVSSPEQRVHAKRVLYFVLDKLPDDQRQLLIMKHIENMSGATIAKQLGKRVSATHKAIRAAEKNFQRLHQRYFGHEDRR